MTKADHMVRPAVIYIARGADRDALSAFARFVRSYNAHPAGCEHNLFIIFKGYRDQEHLNQATALFQGLNYSAIHAEDDSFDLGAYRVAAEQVENDHLCFLNTHSEILSVNWLEKLTLNLMQPSIGIVSATGSYESLWSLDTRFPRFPNLHVRSNAFMLTRELALQVLPVAVENKMAAYLVESGPNGMTRQIIEKGLNALIVGRNGRGYAPTLWPISETFRQSNQNNLLVHDNATRAFRDMSWEQKKIISRMSWGEFRGANPALIQCRSEHPRSGILGGRI